MAQRQNGFFSVKLGLEFSRRKNSYCPSSWVTGQSLFQSLRPSGPPKLRLCVYEAAEDIARATDVWVEDATDKAENALIDAHSAYRKLVSFWQTADERGRLTA